MGLGSVGSGGYRFGIGITLASNGVELCCFVCGENCNCQSCGCGKTTVPSCRLSWQPGIKRVQLRHFNKQNRSTKDIYMIRGRLHSFLGKTSVYAYIYEGWVTLFVTTNECVTFFVLLVN